MKKHILIANIGNRNLLYKGQDYFAWQKERGQTLSFRAFSQKLWKNYEQEKQDISLNILDTFLEEKAELISHVFLFSSDQPKNLRRDQDTLYAGKILSQLIPETYPEIQVANHLIQVPITDNDQLLLTYRKEIRAIVDTFPDHQYLICDAGGTAQQKSALKIICEYLIDREDLEVYYISQGNAYQSELLRVLNIEYRKILDAEQIQGLMEHGQFGGAAEIYAHSHRKAKEEPVYRLLQFCRYRMERMWMEAQKFGKMQDYPEELRPKLKGLHAYNKLAPLGKYEAWTPHIFKRRSYFQLCENYTILERYYQMGAHTQVVLNMFRFIESYLYYALEENLGYPLTKNFNEAQKKLLQEAKTRFPDIALRLGRKRVRGGVPLFILAAAHIPCPGFSQHGYFIKSFESLISILNPEFRKNPNIIPLDTLRHQIAHRGLGISKREFESIPDISGTLAAWGHWLQMPDRNPYEELQEIIIDLL